MLFIDVLCFADSSVVHIQKLAALNVLSKPHTATSKLQQQNFCNISDKGRIQHCMTGALLLTCFFIKVFILWLHVICLLLTV